MTAMHRAHVDLANPPLKLAEFPRRPLSEAPDSMRRDLDPMAIGDALGVRVSSPADTNLNQHAPTDEARAI